MAGALSFPDDQASIRTRNGGVKGAARCRDMGGPDWERELIKAAREHGFLWRTEETYRAWAARFALSRGEMPSLRPVALGA